MNCDMMMTEGREILIFENPEALAAGFADWFYEFTRTRSVVNVALSGGSTPKLFLQELSKRNSHKIDWSAIRFFWGDERCVPPDHEESNFHMTRQYLLDLADIPTRNIYRIRGESPPEAEAARYGDLIKDVLPSNDHLPVFDLVILGLGADGHTASIFPGQMHLLESERVCAVARHPQSGQQRITLTGRVINNATNICFLVAGEGKSEVVVEILDSKGEWEKYPAAYVRPSAGGVGSVRWFLDRGAAGGVRA